MGREEKIKRQEKVSGRRILCNTPSESIVYLRGAQGLEERN